MSRYLIATLLASAWVSAAAAEPNDTQKMMLTGQGPKDAVAWDFTIDGGTRAGEKTTIKVPSNWQQQGFGHYQYGNDRATRTRDRGVYHRSFVVPAGWQGKTLRIVFDAVMTDTLVKVNGVVAGPLHQGGFNRFSYDVTRLVKIGAANDIKVEVAESSANVDTDIAERAGDYWTFGGIYRPVWLEALPAEAIAHVAVDGQASGIISADVTLAAPKTVTRVVGQVTDANGRKLGGAFETAIPDGGTGQVTVRGQVDRPSLWSAETPNLYFLDVTLMKGDEAVHHVRTRFGFRTFEVREGDGLYLNGRKIILKGVNRHAFRPDTGRALDRADSYSDVKLIRGMNMNAVRMSHYSPEERFLEACDELGLYVLDELSGWQHAHDTEVGRRLVRELVERDVNHPSILFWDNGNEGGFNRELDVEYARYDPQRRKVLHPWDPHDGIDTKHYSKYDDHVRRLGGSMLFLPTEFQHGLFDGGAGAGMNDAWKAIVASPRGAGGFVWVFADEGLSRLDQNGRIDNVATLAPDGIVGARHQPEPSYYTIRDLWSPIQITAPTLDDRFDGRIKLANSYDFVAATDLRFKWEWLRYPAPEAGRTQPAILAEGEVAGPAIAPHSDGVLTLPQASRAASADALRLTARRGDQQVMQWVWPTAAMEAPASASRGGGAPRVEQANGAVRLSAGPVVADFDPATGVLTSLSRGGRAVAIGRGPRLVFARPASGEPTWTTAQRRAHGTYAPSAPGMANIIEVDDGLTVEQGWSGFTLQVSPDGTTWRTVYAQARTPREKLTYAFPPQQVAAVRLRNIVALRGTPQIRSVRVGYEAARFNAPELASATIATGTGNDPTSGKPTAWIDAPGAGGLERARWTMDGTGKLTLDYRYTLSGPMLYHGIGFDAGSVAASDVTGLLRGPWPVWQNRMRGPELGVHAVASNAAGAALTPDRAGYFADPRWVKLDGMGTKLVVRPTAPFLQLGAKLTDHHNTSPAFPATAIGFLEAIPAIGNKFHTPAETGPEGQPATAKGSYEGRLEFTLPAN